MAKKKASKKSTKKPKVSVREARRTAWFEAKGGVNLHNHEIHTLYEMDEADEIKQLQDEPGPLVAKMYLA